MSKKFNVFFILSFSGLFILSILSVNIYRSYHFFETETVNSEKKPLSIESSVKKQTDQKINLSVSQKADHYAIISRVLSLTTTLFVDRYVGIEGVLSVSSYPKLGLDLWKKAWDEKYADSGTSFYDKEIMKSPYNNELAAKNHFISLPGLLAFCFYPGSFLFLFFAMMLAGFFAAGVDYFILKLSGQNLILCALMGQVLAYRYSNFGYVPAQSYLLLGTIFISIIMLYAFNQFLAQKSKGVFKAKWRLPV